MNPVTHFELPYDDAGRAREFYQSVFGWQTQTLGPDMNNYILVTTATTDVKPGTPAGSINGGLFPRSPDWPIKHPSLVIGVGDIEQSMAKVTAAGGEALGKPHPILDIGLYVSFIDTEGNRLSMLQPDPGMTP